MTHSTKIALTLAGVAAFCMFSFTRPQDENIQQVPSFQTTIAGATGTIDEKDTREVEFKSGRAKIKSSHDDAKSVIRYDVQLSLGGEPVLCDQLFLYMRYRDNGGDARVVCKLKAYNVDTGSTETLLIVDSNNFTQDNSFQRRASFISGNGIVIITPLKAYFIEVTLTKRSGDGLPELGSLEVWALPN